jgi:cyclohexanone monooxygenase
MPLLEETGYVPTEKYVRGEEIFAHSQAIARQFDLYSNACLQTQLTKIQWDAETARWIVETDRNDAFKARFVCLGGGVMHRAKLPAIPGIEDFEGHAFHTSRWDYSYTGGDTKGNLTGLRDQRVAVIGTGATAIQCVPPIAESAEQLYLFQRTPSSVDVRDNKPTDPDWAATLEPRWQKRRMENFTAILTGLPQDEDLVADRWTDVWRRLAVLGAAGPRDSSDSDSAALVQLADYEKMDEIRARIDAIVENRETAEALKPWYNQFCKRPLYSDEFLPIFNRPNVELVDTQGRGVEKITAHAVHFGGRAYEVDCIVFATGFDVGIPAYERGEYEIVGRGGLNLDDKWKAGISSLHGIMSRGFPNLFLVGNRGQSGRTVNVPHILNEQATHIGAIVARCLSTQVRTIETSQAAEDAWAETMRLKAVDHSKFERECTPGYFNNEGKVDPNRPSILSETYGGGPMEYIQLCEEWLQAGLEKDTELTFEP